MDEWITFMEAAAWKCSGFTDNLLCSQLRSVSASTTFIFTKLYISSDTVYTSWGHVQCLSKVFSMFLVLQGGSNTILSDGLPLFSVSHEADEERRHLKNLHIWQETHKSGSPLAIVKIIQSSVVTTQMIIQWIHDGVELPREAWRLSKTQLFWNLRMNM